MNNTSKQKSSFLIAAPKSNSGKTIVTLGLLQAMKNRKLRVQAFKCGPDYIDPMHHRSISGRASYNLDTWMASEQHVQSVFSRQSQYADVMVAEGVMGLFDGAKKDKGSSAEIAKLLHLPVVLVVDASAVAYSIAPLIYGFKNFDKNLNLCAVIFNKVSGDSHYQFLKEAANDVGVTPLGYLPRNEGLQMESRHLGLLMPQDKSTNKPVALAAELLEKHVDLDKLLKLTEASQTEQIAEPRLMTKTGKTVAIAKDEAFDFIYPANIDALKVLGDVVFFSPLNDKQLPKADVLWFPGGYPELFAKQLSENHFMRDDIASFHENGGHMIAECGGMMYLGKTLMGKENEAFPMCGIFDYATSMDAMKLTLGYRKLMMDNQAFYGHEFHYSTLANTVGKDEDSIAYSARNKEVNMPVYRKQGVWASYMHLYLGEIEKMKAFIESI